MMYQQAQNNLIEEKQVFLLMQTNSESCYYYLD
jgi:hypothetical protein